MSNHSEPELTEPSPDANLTAKKLSLLIVSVLLVLLGWHVITTVGDSLAAVSTRSR